MSSDEPELPDRNEVEELLQTSASPGGPQMGEMLSMLQGEGGLANAMQEPTVDTGDGMYSIADLLADIINIQRLDAKQFGKLHGVDLEIGRMSPEKMAWMLEQMVKGDPGPIIETFNGIQELHEEVLTEAMGEDAYEAFDQMKEENMFTRQRAAETESETADEEGSDD